MKTAFLLLISMMLSLPAAAQQPPRVDGRAVWRTYAQQVPIGSTVKLRLTGGETLTAVLFAVDDSAILVKPATRVAERSRRIAYDDVLSIRRPSDRVSFGKHVAIGAAIGAGTFLMLLLSAQ
jgi:hypothetical protein